jgi:hypothetical protein
MIQAMRERARALGRSITQENGAGTAADFIDWHGQSSKT